LYHYLSGKLVEKQPTSIVLDVHGVGYAVTVPVSTYAQLPELGEPVRILTHFVVREDAQFLCGFFSEQERQMFKLLLSVSGIGPKMAITVLSGIPIPELKAAIVEGALGVLTGISGIGRKTAERMVVELREKIVLEEQPINRGKGAASFQDAMLEDSLRALEELGYRKPNAKQALQRALQDSAAETLSVSDLVRASLKYI